MLEEGIKIPSALDNSFAPKWIFTYELSKVTFDGNF